MISTLLSSDLIKGEKMTVSTVQSPLLSRFFKGKWATKLLDPKNASIVKFMEKIPLVCKYDLSQNVTNANFITYIYALERKISLLCGKAM